MIPFVFDAGFGFERYVEWALDVPMYFVKRGDAYHRATHVTFRQFMNGALAGELPGVTPSVGDWDNHLGTLFPEVRLKRYLEMRGADSGSERHILALPAFWVGLMYDETALGAAEDLIRGWTTADMQTLRDDVPVQALGAKIAGRSVREVAREAIAIARDGLKRRGYVNCCGLDETVYLGPLDLIVERGKTEAEVLVDKFGTDFEALFAACEMTPTGDLGCL
jgi:glutamate--cysteine ligase